jgi:2-haloalkanoic acid dehalogenase type II
MSTITTVIFDMYDTLVQNDPRRWRSTFEEIIQEQGLDTNFDTLWREWHEVDQRFRAFRVQEGSPFHTYRQGWKNAFVQSFVNLGLTGDPEAAVDKSISDLSRRPPFPDTKEALKLIQQRWRTAVASNADDDYLLPNLEELGVAFDAVVSSEEVRSYKPHSALFQEALRRLGISASEAVYLGDRQFEDVLGASQVGIVAGWVNRPQADLDPELPEPVFQVRSLLEVPSILAARDFT